MASPRLSTAGMTLQYCVEETAGTRPTTGYTKIPEVKSMPSFNPSPNTIDSTTLEETEYMTYVQGLKDLGGALEYGANLTEDLIDAWDTLMEAYDTAIEGGKQVWFAVVHPRPLSQLGKAQLTTFINQLSKLPSVIEELDKSDLDKFATQMERLAQAMAPLATEMQKVANGFSAFPIRIQKIIQSNSALAASNNKTAKSFGVLGTGISSTSAKFSIYYLAFRRIASVASNWVKESNDYVENLNLFTVNPSPYHHP